MLWRSFTGLVYKSSKSSHNPLVLDVRYRPLVRTNLLLKTALVASGLAITPQAVFAQQISFGVVAGTNLTKDFQARDPSELIPGSYWKSGGSSFIIGPMMEVS